MNEEQNQNKSKIGIAITISIILTTVIIGGAGAFFYYQQNSEMDDREGVLNSKIDELEINISELKKENGDKDSTTKKDEDAKTETDNLKTYTNAEYDYSLKYPSDWSYTEISKPSDVVVGKTVKYVKFESPGEKYLLTFGLKKSGESEILLSERTGTSEGDLEQGEKIKLGQYTLDSVQLVYQNHTNDIFIPGEGKNADINGHEVYIEFGHTETTDINDQEEYDEFLDILSTFSF